MGTQWAGMGQHMMRLPEFRESILRSDMALKDTGLCLSNLLLEADEGTFEDTVHAFVALAAIQVPAAASSGTATIGTATIGTATIGTAMYRQRRPVLLTHGPIMWHDWQDYVLN